MSVFTYRGLVVAAAVSLLACSSDVPADQVGVAGPPTIGRATGALTLGQPVLSGYQHTSSLSGFAIGPTLTQRSEFGMSKVIGQYGVFATNASTGMVIAMPNANSPARARSPLTTDPNGHNAAVRSYFVSAGLPDTQILNVSEQAIMQGGGREGIYDPKTDIVLDFYFSTLSRKASNGVPVIDSFAWARINADHDVVSESVYWPELPASVLSAAETLRQTMADSNLRAAFFAKLPIELSEQLAFGRAVIRHSSGVWTKGFTAIASYDVPIGNRLLHFDVTGTKIDLPEEATDAWGPTMNTPR